MWRAALPVLLRWWSGVVGAKVKVWVPGEATPPRAGLLASGGAVSLEGEGTLGSASQRSFAPLSTFLEARVC